MKPKLLIGVLAAALIAGGGAFAFTRFMAPADDEAVSYVPAGAIGYSNVFIRPSNGQKQALDELLRKFPGIDSTDEAIDALVEQIDEALEEEGMSYEADVEPWLGDQVAAFLISGGTADRPNFAVLVESDDDAALDEFVDGVAEASEVELVEKTYEGAAYRMQADEDEEPIAIGAVEGFLVAGTEDAFKAAVDAHAGEDALDEDEDFVAATEPLNDDWIGLFYVDTAALVRTFGDEGLTSQETAALGALGFQKPAAAVVYATDDSVVFEGSAAGGGDAPDDGDGIVPHLAPEAWAAVGIPDVGASIREFFDVFATAQPGFDRAGIEDLFLTQTGVRLEEDLLSWMGDAGLFVQGTSIQEIGGGLVVESNDAEKTRGLLEKLRAQLLAAQDVRPVEDGFGGLDGVAVHVPGVPAPIYVLAGDRFVVAYGEDAARAASGEGETLGDSEAFSAAQDDVGDDFDVSFFLDVDAAQAFGEAVAGFGGAPMDTYEADVKPYLDALSHVVAASRSDGDTVVGKLVVGFE